MVTSPRIVWRSHRWGKGGEDPGGRQGGVIGSTVKVWDTGATG